MPLRLLHNLRRVGIIVGIIIPPSTISDSYYPFVRQEPNGFGYHSIMDHFPSYLRLAN